jgi:hypothetical protein
MVLYILIILMDNELLYIDYAKNFIDQPRIERI